MNLDIPTIVVLRLGVDVLIALLFLDFYRRHSAVGGPGWWCLSSVMSFFGTVCMAMSLDQLSWFWVGLSFTALSATFAFSWLGLRSFLGMSIPLRQVLMALLGMFIVQAMLVGVWDCVAVRRSLFALSIIAVSLLSLRDIRRHDPKGHISALAPLRWLLWVVILGLAVMMGRVWIAIYEQDLAFLRDNAPRVVMGFTMDIMARAAIAVSLLSSRLRQESDRTHRKLQASVDESRALVDNLSAGVMVFNRDETLVSANAAARHFLGWPDQRGATEYMEHVPKLRLLREDGQAMAREEIPLNRVLAARAAVNGMVLGVQTRHRPEVRWALCNGYPQTDTRGVLRQVVLSFLDITPLKTAEAEQKHLQEHLMQSQKMESLGTLAGGIAHDFNNILAAILGNADLARQDLPQGHASRESLHEISGAARRGRELVRQILAYSRQQPMSRTLADINAIVNDSCRLLRMALTPNVQLLHKTNPNMPALLADSSQLGQVFLNLGTNAVHALQGKTGAIEFRVETVLRDDPRLPTVVATSCASNGVDAVCVWVRDEGAGMEPATVQRMFDPFFTTKAVGEGTGLGLPVVQGIVEAHGGAIEVQSTPGLGTCFKLYFAAATPAEHSASRSEDGTMNVYEPPADTDEASQPFAHHMEPSHMSAAMPATPQHILYLDDDDTLVFLVQRLLERRGYLVSAFSTQEDAIDAVRQSPAKFALLLTDYNMPGMSGIEVAKQVRALNPDLPVAVASGYITDELKSEAAAAGVCEVVFKTDAVEEFCDVVARLIRV